MKLFKYTQSCTHTRRTTPRAHSLLRPRPQRSTGGDVRSLVGCLLKETLHCCRVTLVVFSNGGSDSPYIGHHLLWPLLSTMLAKSRSQTEWASLPESRPPLRPSTNPPVWIVTQRALIRTASGKEGDRNIQTEATTRAWHEGLQKPILSFNAAIDEDEDDIGWCYGGSFWDNTQQGRRPLLQS